jgi:hypothetical protein
VGGGGGNGPPSARAKVNRASRQRKPVLKAVVGFLETGEEVLSCGHTAWPAFNATHIRLGPRRRCAECEAEQR